MNAIFDAPMDEKGRPYVVTSNATKILTKKEKKNRNWNYLNEKNHQIYVKDHFGSFSSEKAMTLIQKDYMNRAYKNRSNRLNQRALAFTELWLVV